MRSIQLLWVAVAGLLGLMAQSAQAQTQPAPPLSSESYYGQIFTSEEIGRLEALARSVRENRDLRQQGVRLVAEAENLRRLAQMETRARRQRRGMKRAEQTQQQADQTLAQALRGIYQAQGEIFVLYANKAEAEYDTAATRARKRQGEEYERAAFDWLDNQARPAFESGEKATTEATRQQQWAQADSLQQKALLSMENAFRRYRGQPPYDPGRPFVDEDVRSAEEVRTAIDSLSRVNPSSTGWLDAVRRIEESARRLRQQAEGSDNPAVQNVLGQQIRELESQAQASLGESVQFRLNQNLERYQDYQYRFRGVNPTEADLQKEPVKAARALELAGWALFNDAKAKILSASASTGNHASLFLLQSDDIERRAMQKLDVKDSKAISSDKKAMAIGAELRKLLGKRFALVSIGPAAYNRLYAKMRSVNRILAWGHARAIENLLEAVPGCPTAISDQFGSKESVERALMKAGRGIELIQRHKAESDMAVAAASILARESFLHALQKMREQYSAEIPKGASAAVRGAAVALVRRTSPETLLNTVKCHFKTTDAVLADLGITRANLPPEGQIVSKPYTRPEKTA